MSQDTRPHDEDFRSRKQGDQMSLSKNRPKYAAEPIYKWLLQSKKVAQKIGLPL
jgi:hypothetical protein